MIAVSIYLFFAFFITFFFGLVHDQSIFYNIPTLSFEENLHLFLLVFVFFLSLIFYKKMIYKLLNESQIKLIISKNLLNYLVFLIILLSFYGYIMGFNDFRYAHPDQKHDPSIILYIYRIISTTYGVLLFIIFFQNSYKKNYLEIFYYLSPYYFLINGITQAIDLVFISLFILLFKYENFFKIKKIKHIKKFFNFNFFLIILSLIPIIIFLLANGIKVKEKKVNLEALLTYTNSTWVYDRFYTHQASLINSLKPYNKFEFNNYYKSFNERYNNVIGQNDYNILKRNTLNEWNNDIIYKHLLLRSGSTPGIFATFFYHFNNSLSLIIIFFFLIFSYFIFDKILQNSDYKKNLLILSFITIFILGRGYFANPLTFLLILDETFFEFIILIYLSLIKTKIV